jgi:hypothetical protein
VVERGEVAVVVDVGKLEGAAAAVRRRDVVVVYKYMFPTVPV